MRDGTIGNLNFLDEGAWLAVPFISLMLVIIYQQMRNMDTSFSSLGIHEIGCMTENSVTAAVGVWRFV